MTFIVKICVMVVLIGLLAESCVFPDLYQGEWRRRWATINVNGSYLNNNRGRFQCMAIRYYEDEANANTILVQDVVGYERPYYTIYCYYCLFARRLNDAQLAYEFRDTLCSRHGAPSVDYGCPSSNKFELLRLTVYNSTSNAVEVK